MSEWISVEDDEEPPNLKPLFLYDRYEDEFGLGYYDESQETFIMMKMNPHMPDSLPTHWMVAVAPEE